MSREQVRQKSLIDTRSNTFIDLELLRRLCRQVRFEPGDVLRRKGQHYRDMYVITDGCVGVNRETNRHAGTLLVSDPGSPVGEISFLRGCSATATVTARAATSALLIDDQTLARLEQEQPELTARLLRHLAETAEERTSYNLVWSMTAAPHAPRHPIEVHLCRTPDMLESAKRLRYEVYCEELGRFSPCADNYNRIITDRLDETGVVFIAIEDGETIGTLRGNASRESALGVLEELYGMKASPHHPQATAICTKFIVKKSKRGGLAAMKLISAMVRYGLRNGIKRCYIDTIPVLLPYYKAIGFTTAGPKFLHLENGPSIPMMLDVVKHGGRLSRESAPREYLKLIMKAQAIKLVDSFIGCVRASRRHE